MMNRKEMKLSNVCNIIGLLSLVIVICLSTFTGLANATIVLNPSQDNYINRCSCSGTRTNYGGAAKLLVRSFDGDGCTVLEPKSVRSMIQFDLSGLTELVETATLKLYYYNKLGSTAPAGRTYQVRRLLNDWTEGTGTEPGVPGTVLGSSWENRHNDGTTEVNWDTHNLSHIDDGHGCSGWSYLGGGDLPYTDCAGGDHWGGDEIWGTSIVPVDYGWMEWNVTALIQAWDNGTYANNGLIVMDSAEQWHAPFGEGDPFEPWPGKGKWGAWFRSSEYGDSAYQPQLEITYIPEPATIALLGLGALGLLRRKRA